MPAGDGRGREIAPRSRGSLAGPGRDVQYVAGDLPRLLERHEPLPRPPDILRRGAAADLVEEVHASQMIARPGERRFPRAGNWPAQEPSGDTVIAQYPCSPAQGFRGSWQDGARRRVLQDTLIQIRSHAPLPRASVVERMKFIALVKFRGKPTRDEIAMHLGRMEAEAKVGITYLSSYWMLGRYDAALTFEAPDERTAMAAAGPSRIDTAITR